MTWQLHNPSYAYTSSKGWIAYHCPTITRVYEDSDLKVFMFIKSMADRNISLDEIALVLGQPETTTTLALSPQEQIDKLELTINDLRNEVYSLTCQNDLLQEQLADAQSEIKRLTAEKAVLEYRLVTAKGE